MSENKHTPEPWHLCEVENETGRIKHLVPVDSEKLSLLTIVENDQGTFAAIYNDEDARRIVACVNACAGVPTERLESDKYVHPKLLQVQVDALRNQRDELLAAIGTQAATDVLAERQRQITAEGWTPDHDDQHEVGELATAAACYAGNAGGYVWQGGWPGEVWPWAREWWKPSTPRRDLVKSAAMILAEIERIDRAAIARAKGGAA